MVNKEGFEFTLANSLIFSLLSIFGSGLFLGLAITNSSSVQTLELGVLSLFSLFISYLMIKVYFKLLSRNYKRVNF